MSDKLLDRITGLLGLVILSVFTVAVILMFGAAAVTFVQFIISR